MFDSVISSGGLSLVSGSICVVGAVVLGLIIVILDFIIQNGIDVLVKI